jgi:putative transposase
VLKKTVLSAPTMAAVCGWYGISRQAHYQMLKRRAQRAQEATVVCAEVRKIRHFHPRMGGRKLHKELASRLHLAGIGVGRDRFFEILRRDDLLVEPLGSGRRTTWPGTWRCRNLLAEATITGPNQAWAGDITYLATEEGFCYLALLTDVHSRYIVGFDLSTSLSVEGAERALLQAVKSQGRLPRGLIHHSDRGIQYTCHSYRRKLKKYGLRSSMGRTGNCYDNALAERVNGILKLEYGLGGCFTSVAQAATAVVQAIWLYNHERPHLALGYGKPHEFHRKYLRRQRSSDRSSIFSRLGAQKVPGGRAA